MKKYILALFIFCLLLAIVLIVQKQKEHKAVEPLEQTVVSIDLSGDAQLAKTFLEKAVMDYFSDDSQMQKITTPVYYEYKSDATAVDMDGDGSLTAEELEAKWKDRYETEYAGIGAGFLISGQDWSDNMKITQCDLLSEGNGSYLFHVIISDVDFQADYVRDIKVVKSDGKFLIDNIKEYN